MVFLGPQDPRPRLAQCRMLLYQVNARHVARNVPNTRSSEQVRVRQETRNSPQEELGDAEGMVDDDCFPDDREVWEVTHVREEDVETTEGEGVDFLGELLDLSGWTLVDDDETEPELS